MPVVGMSIRKIEAIREMERATGEVKINSNTNLKKVTEMDIGSLKEKGLSIDFEHVINYVATEGELAKINISGMVLYYDKNQDELLKHWEEKKRLPEDVNLEVINALIRRCVVKALILSEDLQLPPPINLPVAVKGKKE